MGYYKYKYHEYSSPFAMAEDATIMSRAGWEIAEVSIVGNVAVLYKGLVETEEKENENGTEG